MDLCANRCDGYVGCSNQHDRVAVASHRGVMRHQSQRFDQGLGYENAVERVVVMSWERLDRDCVFGIHRQKAITRLLEIP